MKTKFNNLLIFASAGALLHTGSLSAGDAQIKAGARAGQADANVELRGDINEPAGAELQLGSDADLAANGQFQRASDLIGKDVFNDQNEKIGEVKDVIVDLQSGHAPFAVVSSGGFFGVGDRYLAVPASSFSHSSDNDSLRLSMDKERLQSAPSFDRNSWPDMTDNAWRSQVYSYYGQPEPSMSSHSIASTSSSIAINEPAGAENTQHRRDYSQDREWMRGSSSDASQSYGETETGLDRDRTPRQGLGVEDLTKNEQKIYNPGGYAESDAFFSEAAGAERSHSRVGASTSTTTREKHSGWTKGSAISETHLGKTQRASDLIGMEVENAQGERIGEIKDVVVDLDSGRVAYTVLSAGGILGAGDKLYAVPPAVFTRSTDNNILVFNTDKETLKSAPGFERENWDQTNNRQFTTEVYRYYNQPMYWQSSTDIREPSGAQPKLHQQHQDDSFGTGKWQRSTGNQQQGDRPQIQEPSGAEPSNQSQPQSSTSDSTQQGATLNEPSGAEPERQQSPNASENTPQADQSQSSAAKESAELDAAKPAEQDAAQEPAGATTSTAPATSEDQASGDADRMLSQRLRTTLKDDPSLSGKTENVQVSATNGRLTLRGSVSSEQEKQMIEAKAKEIAGSADKVDNQLRVTETTNP